MKAADLAAALLALPPNTEIYVYNGEFCILSPAHLHSCSFEVCLDPTMKPQREGDLTAHMDFCSNDELRAVMLSEGYEYRTIHWIGYQNATP